jgi:hypothetical protein
MDGRAVFLRDIGAGPARFITRAMLVATIRKFVHRSSGAHAGNRLDVSAYRCVDVAGRNRQNCSASIVPVMAGCHPARAFNNVIASIRFPILRNRMRLWDVSFSFFLHGF